MEIEFDLEALEQELEEGIANLSEGDLKLLNQPTCLGIIYANWHKKYSGDLSKRGNRWRYCYPKYKKYITLATLGEAIEYKKKFSIMQGEYENLVYNYGDYYEIQLSGYKFRVLVDKYMYNILDEYILTAELGCEGYHCVVKSKKLLYPRLPYFLLADKLKENDIIYHKNDDNLDCRLDNLVIMNINDYHIMIGRQNPEEKIIFPDSAHKYMGSINDHVKGFIVVITRYNIVRMFKDYNTALKYRINKAKQLYEVRNITYDCGDHYEMELFGGKRTKIDKEDLPLTQEYTITINKEYAELTTSDSKKVKLHNYLMNFISNNGLTIDHINRDPLDNRKANLRIANKTIQTINRTMHANNTLGVVGIEYRVDRQTWIANWQENKTKKCKSFSIKQYGFEEARQMAIDYRAHIENTLPDYKLALYNQI